MLYNKDGVLQADMTVLSQSRAMVGKSVLLPVGLVGCIVIIPSIISPFAGGAP